MRHIMVMNAKGGCGKSTLATNIASYFANEGANVALADYDPQRSSLDWLERRPGDRPAIAGVAAFEDGMRHCPRSADICVIDAPARTHAKELTDLVRHAEAFEGIGGVFHRFPVRLGPHDDADQRLFTHCRILPALKWKPRIVAVQ